MLFEQYPFQDPLTLSINDGGINELNFDLTLFDFTSLNDINIYLSPTQSKPTEYDLSNDSINNDSQCQEEFCPDFDFIDFDRFDEKSDSISIDDIEIGKWISQSSFPSPPMDTTDFLLLNGENASSIGTEDQTSTDTIAPLSPSLTSTDSSPILSIKRRKLSIGERRLRKKSQNKTAAEKYRIKKRSEHNQLLDRHSKLKDVNRELKSELENLTFHVQRFKQIFIDLFQIDPIISN